MVPHKTTGKTPGLSSLSWFGDILDLVIWSPVHYSWCQKSCVPIIEASPHFTSEIFYPDKVWDECRVVPKMGKLCVMHIDVPENQGLTFPPRYSWISTWAMQSSGSTAVCLERGVIPLQNKDYTLEVWHGYPKMVWKRKSFEICGRFGYRC